MSKPEDDQNNKPDAKGSFNKSAKYLGVASGISGGMIFMAISLALYANTDSKLWLIGAAAGVLGTLGTFVQLVQMSRQDEADAKKNKDHEPPGPKPPKL